MSKKKEDTAEIDKLAAEAAKGDTLTNTGINRRCISGIDIPKGGTYVLTKMDKADMGLMIKVDRAIELGVLARD